MVVASSVKVWVMVAYLTSGGLAPNVVVVENIQNEVDCKLMASNILLTHNSNVWSSRTSWADCIKIEKVIVK